jgi:hypothetical protein
LYDIVKDPRETTDLSTLYPERFERMKATLIDYDNEVLSETRDWWQRDPRMRGKVPQIATD